MKLKKWMKRGLIIILALIFLIAVGIFINYYFFKTEEKKSFELDTLFLKVAITEGSSSASSIKIINTGDKSQHFSIEVKEIGELIKVDSEEFDLNAGEEHDVRIFINSTDKEPGVYLGELEISSGATEKIPVILEIQSERVLFDSNVNLFPQTNEIVPGSRLNAEIKIFDLLGVGRSNVNFIYSIRGFDGKTIVSESEALVVDGKLDYSKTLDLPKNLELGNYVFTAVLKYEDSVGTSSLFFKVVEKAETSVDITIVYIAISLGIIFLVFLALFIYSLFYRDRLLRGLQEQYEKELKRQKELILGREKIDYAKLRTAAEKTEYKKEIERIKKERLKTLREIQRRRLEKYKKIKKDGKKNHLKKQLEAWKRQGYNTVVLEQKYKIPSVNDIKKKVSQWKKKGYETRVLEKKLEK